VPADFDLSAEQATGSLDARIRAVIGDRPYSVAWQSVYRFQSRVASRMRVGRVLLAGDCAHLFSPFGARGLNSGVADAENAAWKLGYVLHGWAPDGLLDSYHAERHAAALENLAVTTATMDFLVPQDDEQRRRRLAALQAAAEDPAASAAVDSGRLAEPYWYDGSPLTTPDRSRPFAGRPARGAVPPAGPGIVLPDLAVAGSGSAGSGSAGPGRLRALARDGFLLLAAPGADLAAGRAVAAAAACPLQVLAMADADPSGRLAAALDARPGETWLVRPDAYVAAVAAGSADGLAVALRRALGYPALAAPNDPEITGSSR
jgi:pentachlorophenol monooxygenase/3-(3-hydroxy-phenyl)propionate hydroxylase